ncbi:hybrid sensor histidine kinase/response regulator [Granulosicoccus antarcticus]|uniref:histidine kinase n=1 Tax=Granulosicoccus antarcticus IMCC3135 TaxID=1192854 RepID=A0A2Z2NHU9_9GAMM|nr:hybrid sensor histidine kinase/response regulator [Granulosicoccus antarcticus]ASJ70876.1 Blue-light-activated protein [Granulosicoccus antarcticus IMCC3135]
MFSSDSEKLFDLLSLAPDLAVLVTSSGGVVKSVNKAASDLFCKDKAELEGCHLLSTLVVPARLLSESFTDFASLAQQGLDVRLASNVDEHVSVRVIELEVTPVEFAVSFTRITLLQDSGLPQGSHPGTRDQAGLLLSVAEEISEFGCYSWDMVKDVLEWSDGLFRIFDIDRSDFSRTAEAFFNRLHPSDRGEFNEALTDAASGHGHFHSTERILRPNGDVRWMQSQGRMVFDSNGKPLKLTGICRDITEKVENGNELRMQIDDRKALESKLLQTQKLEAIGKLSSGIAHDFNNLLTVISSGCDFLQILPPEAMRDDARDLVQSIKEAGDRASELTSQLLLYSRSSTGQPQAVDLNAAVEQSREFLIRTLPKSISISLVLHPEAPILHIDPTQLQQIVLNLALNAKDAMPGGGQLAIETGVVMRASISSEDSGMIRYAVLQVVDTGTGVSEELRSRMFDPFYTTKPTGSGSGLGLSVVWGIVHAAGGTIEVESEIGTSTSFRIFLPISAHEEPVRVGTTDRVFAGGKTSILVIEDEAAVLAIVEAALRHAGFEVTGVTDPVEAIRLAANPAHRIDLLVTDVSMPTLSGPEVVKSIRGVRSATWLPVLFISGNDQHVLERTHGIRAEENNLIQKPFRIAALINKVEEVLSNAAQRDKH